MTFPVVDTKVVRLQLPKGTKHAASGPVRLNQLVQLLRKNGINFNVEDEYKPPHTDKGITYHRVRYLVNGQPHEWSMGVHRDKTSAREEAAASLVQKILTYYNIAANY